MVDKDLRIDVSAPGAKEAAADVAAVNAEIAETGAAQESGIRYTEASVNAYARLSDAFKAAEQAMGKFAVSTIDGSSSAEKALTKARDRVAELAVAIDAAKAAGAPIPPNVVSTLQTFDATIEAATIKQEAMTVSTIEASNAQKLLRAESQASVAVLGPFGRALGTLAQGTDSWVSSLAKAIIPLAAAAVAVAGINKVLGDLKERGVETTTIGDLLEHAMDSLAVTFGGTSKAAKQAEDAFRSQQGALADLEVATIEFKTGLDLMAAAGLDAAKGLAAIQPAAAAAGDEFTYIRDQAAHGTETLNSFNQSLNAIRVTSPTAAREIARNFIEIARAAEQGVDGATEAFQKLAQETRKSADESRKLLSEIKDEYGKDGPAAFGKFSAAAFDVTEKLRVLKEAGFTDAEAFKLLKSEILTASNGAEFFAKKIQEMPPALRAAAEEALKMEKSYGGLRTELSAAEKVLSEQVLKFNAIRDAVDAGTQRLGDHKVAVQGVAKEIDSLIAQLERQRDVDGKLGVSQQTILDVLTKWRAEMGRGNSELDKANKAVDDYAKKVAGLSGELEKNRQQFEKNLIKIEEHRQKSIAAAEQTSRAAIKSVDDEIKATEKSYKDGEIQSSEYFSKIAELQNKELAIKRKTQDQETEINKESEDQRADLVQKDTEAKTKIQENLRELNVSVKEATEIRTKLQAAERDRVKTLQDQEAAEAAARIATSKHAETQRDFAKDLKDTSDATHKAHENMTIYSGVVGGSVTQMRDAASAANALADALQRVAAASSAASGVSGGSSSTSPEIPGAPGGET